MHINLECDCGLHKARIYVSPGRASVRIMKDGEFVLLAKNVKRKGLLAALRRYFRKCPRCAKAAVE